MPSLLSHPSKMPGAGFGLPASECKVGGKLREVPGSVCSRCYAHKGNYTFPVVQNAQAWRFSLLDDLPAWETTMVDAIEAWHRKKPEVPFFRWHDSGDLQSLAHFEAILNVIRRTPSVHHWLPTREYPVLHAWVKTHPGERIPSNLTLRVSMAKVGQAPSLPAAWAAAGFSTSTVGAYQGIGHQCPARHQGNKCGDCRFCWLDSANVNYPLH